MTKKFVTVRGKKYYLTVKRKRYHVFNLHYTYDRLNVRGAGITDIREIKGLNKLTSLWELDLSYNTIKEIHGLEHLTDLRWLGLSNNEIEEIKGLEYLSHLFSHLRKLYLGGNPIKEIERYLTGNSVWKGKSLQKVVKYCRDKKRGKLPFVTVKGKEYYAPIGKLDLSRLSITDIAEIQGLERLSQLKELNLSSNCIEEIKGLEHLTTLRKLNLNDNPIRISERHLVWKRAQEVVKYCQDKKRGKLPFVTVKGKKHYAYKYKLTLSKLNLTDITEIHGLQNLTNLLRLNLNENQITEIRGLEQLTNLQKLALRSNEIEKIKGFETLTDLQVIDLRGNPIKEEERHLILKSAQELVKYCQEKMKE
jgi:Leucine-rich repeat (LRR) protein